MELDFTVKNDNTEFTAIMDNVTYTWKSIDGLPGPLLKEDPSTITRICEAATFRQAEIIVRNDSLNEIEVRKLFSNQLIEEDPR